MLTREELLGGLPARRASTLLFAIENRTAHLVTRARHILAPHRPDASQEEAERAFLDALGQGRALPLQPSIQDIERYAPHWAPLVPADDGVRAVVARMMGEKYPLAANRIPGIVAALGLDLPEVAARFETLHAAPLGSTYSVPLTARERWSWTHASTSARLEDLPPFWTAFALTLTETVGASVLALPIAFATVGPIAGVVVLLILGLVNIVTIGAMSEAIGRNGDVRYGRGYLGRMVGDYLGSPGVRLLSPSLVLVSVVILLAYFIGLASTLSDATDVAAEFWAAGLFLVLLAYLRRDDLSATTASRRRVSPRMCRRPSRSRAPMGPTSPRPTSRYRTDPLSSRRMAKRAGWRSPT